MPMNPRLLRPLARRQATDPLFSQVALLLHMDGANGSTTFTDSSQNAIQVSSVGDAQISTAQSKFGGASALFDGNGDQLGIQVESGELNLNGVDFTVEMWVYPNDTGYGSLFLQPSAFHIHLFDNPLQLHVNDAQVGSIASGSLSVGQWHHVAVTCDAGTIRAFIDGQQIADSDFSVGSSSTVKIGWDDGSGALNGYLEELRVTKGAARYTANFTPPTAAFPDG